MCAFLQGVEAEPGVGRKRGRSPVRGSYTLYHSSNTDVSNGADTSIHFTAKINLNIYISVFSGMFVLVINLKTTLCNQISALSLCLRYLKCLINTSVVEFKYIHCSSDGVKPSCLVEGLQLGGKLPLEKKLVSSGLKQSQRFSSPSSFFLPSSPEATGWRKLTDIIVRVCGRLRSMGSSHWFLLTLFESGSISPGL